MRLPRDLSGAELARLLERFGYEAARQSGSHLRLVSRTRGRAHQVTVPLHRAVRVGTLSEIVADVANYLGRDRDEVAEELFG